MTTRWTTVWALVVLAGAIAGALGAWLLLARDDATRYTARFTNARGLIAGNDVRVGGAVAGRVTSVELAGDGSAQVRFTVSAGAATPRADATAAIRPVDLLGDTYMALSPGHSPAALQGSIAALRTANAPRLDELLRTFSPSVRDGLQSLLVETGLALDARGGDLARSAVALRPALLAADRVASELDGQNASLARLLPSAERALSQLGDRSADVGRLLDGLSQTLTQTAAQSAPLEQAIAGLPATLARVRGTATRLSATASAARPIAVTLRDSAPALSATLTQLRPFITRLRATAAQLRPALRSLRRTLAGGRTALPKLDRALRTLLPALPDVRTLIATIEPAAPGIAKGFLENFPDQAAEPGTQPFDPFADPRRRYWRGAAVMSCEAFGVPVRPGCLTDVLAATTSQTTKGTVPKPGSTNPKVPHEKGVSGEGTVPFSSAGVPEAITDLPVVPKVTKAVDELLDFLLKP